MCLYYYDYGKFDWTALDTSATVTGGILGLAVNGHAVPFILYADGKDSNFIKIIYLAGHVQWFQAQGFANLNGEKPAITMNGNRCVVTYLSRGVFAKGSPVYDDIKIYSKKTNSFKLYPNPVKSSANVFLQDIRPGSSISITDIQGRVVLAQQLQQQGTGVATVQLGDLIPGVYLVSVVSGDERVTEKLVVH